MQRKNYPILTAVGIPFLITRGLLWLAGLLAPYVMLMSTFQRAEVVQRGWLFVPNRLIDMWARWDAGWYMSIVNEGYRLVVDVHTASNLAFFPVYPLIIKAITFLIPGRPISDTVLIGMGILVSNLFLFGALIFLYKLTTKLFASEKVAQRAIWYLLVFPSAFFLSSVYTESTFLFFSVASFWYATQNKWWLACLLAAVVGATRPNGILIGVPLLLLYLQQRDWKLEKIDTSILWFGLVPLGLLAFFSHMYDLTGDFMAAIKVQSAWGRKVSDPFHSFFWPAGYWPFITQLDQIFMLSSLITGVAMLKGKVQTLLPYAVYTLLLISPTLFTGTLDSTARFTVVVFPLFMIWGYWAEKYLKADWGIKIGLMILQMVLFAFFTQSYWVG